MSNDAITSFVSYMANAGYSANTNWFVQVESYGGSNSKINSVPQSDTSFLVRGIVRLIAKNAADYLPQNRNSLFNIQFYTSAQNGQSFPQQGFSFLDSEVAGIRNFSVLIPYFTDMVSSITSKMPSNWDFSAYLNYIDDHLDNWQDLYYGSNYGRLQQIKSQYDPQNVLSEPFSVEPSSASNTTTTSSASASASASKTSAVTSAKPSNANNNVQTPTSAATGLAQTCWLLLATAISVLLLL